MNLIFPDHNKVWTLVVADVAHMYAYVDRSNQYIAFSHSYEHPLRSLTRRCVHPCCMHIDTLTIRSHFRTSNQTRRLKKIGCCILTLRHWREPKLCISTRTNTWKFEGFKRMARLKNHKGKIWSVNIDPQTLLKFHVANF